MIARHKNGADFFLSQTVDLCSQSVTDVPGDLHGVTQPVELISSMLGLIL